MTIESVRRRCLAFPGVTEDIKWDDDLVFSVGGKMFCVAMLEPPHRLSFKCDDETFAELIEREGIIPAPYLARAKWVSLESLDGAMEWPELEIRLLRAYELVKASLTKKARAALDAAREAVRSSSPRAGARQAHRRGSRTG
jgi:predicted DNA-binding protein (MmcQ/YjbR family)